MNSAMRFSKPTILVVDDDQDITANITDILEDCGYRADKAHDGATALAFASRLKYDVALLDYKMPDIDGATLFAKLRCVQPDLVAIMITAYAGSDGVKQAYQAGAWLVLKKPVDVKELLEQIAKAIA